MPTVRTGPVRVSGYAIKLRRVVNAALRSMYKEGRLNAKQINELLSELNRKIYSVLVEKFEIPKDTVVNITLEYYVEDSEFRVKDIQIDVYDRDDILSRNATSDVKKLVFGEGVEQESSQ